ncbi:membrane protease YdiL (CAAX protease family) [Paenibacillus amylolyticus]|uniref:Membrane protease YdiL (CAAX protease family) n=1 Tax=Paenibacillus amylolyticus TaxID=1451 RepID=A0AAP5GW58_PAEAM|nr:CPBP family intramembrane glutamic endopeptidase [Paenibacillus amylolyticus]MDR6721689.1 membrane protease YdiL (CAAX protease family) [Paenibacillus amylolyticus]
MEPHKEKPTNTTKNFSPRDAGLVFLSFSFICAAIIFALIINDVLTLQHFLSMDSPLEMIGIIVFSTIGLLLFGVILSSYIPAKYIDDTNKSYPDSSIPTLLLFMFVGALFEEMLFRGIVQNVLYLFIESKWIAILTTTLLFIGFHIQYFKKPIMLINITIPSLVFGWIYTETNNLAVPVLVHFLMNVGITLLFKYNIIRLKR